MGSLSQSQLFVYGRKPDAELVVIGWEAELEVKLSWRLQDGLNGFESYLKE